jgi:phosphopantetheine--protein transferase-like protein
MVHSLFCSKKKIRNFLNQHPLHLFLTDDECALYTSLPTEKRKEEWLAGRVVAKILIGEWLGRLHNLPSSLVWRQFEVRNGRTGIPYVVFLKSFQNTQNTPLISLSHTGGTAIVALSTQGKVGVDLIQKRSFSDAVANYFLDPKELLQLQNLEEKSKQKALCLFWVAKEAYLKALGVGLTVPLKNIQVKLSFNHYEQPTLAVIDAAQSHDIRVFSRQNKRFFSVLAIVG